MTTILLAVFFLASVAVTIGLCAAANLLRHEVRQTEESLAAAIQERNRLAATLAEVNRVLERAKSCR